MIQALGCGVQEGSTSVAGGDGRGRAECLCFRKGMRVIWQLACSPSRYMLVIHPVAPVEAKRVTGRLRLTNRTQTPIRPNGKSDAHKKANGTQQIDKSRIIQTAHGAVLLSTPGSANRRPRPVGHG